MLTSGELYRHAKGDPKGFQRLRGHAGQADAPSGAAWAQPGGDDAQGHLPAPLELGAAQFALLNLGWSHADHKRTPFQSNHKTMLLPSDTAATI